MPAPFSSRELVAALTEMGYQPVDRAGSHLKLRYVYPGTGERRNVTILMREEVSGKHSATLLISSERTTFSRSVTGSTISWNKDPAGSFIF